MLLYQYRWLLAVLLSGICCAIGFFFDTQYSMQQMFSLQQEVSELRAQNAKVVLRQPASSANKVVTQPQQPNNVLTDLLALAQVNGLITQTIVVKPVRTQAMPALEVQLSMQADFAAFLAFITALDQQRYPVFIQDFSYELDAQQKLFINMTVLLLKSATERIQLLTTFAHSVSQSNPFCQAIPKQPSSYQFGTNKTWQFPLQLLKMVGYLQDGNIQQAFIALPNHEVIAIAAGCVIGAERGTVSAVLHDHIVVQTQDKKITNLY